MSFPPRTRFISHSCYISRVWVVPAGRESIHTGSGGSKGGIHTGNGGSKGSIHTGNGGSKGGIHIGNGGSGGEAFTQATAAAREAST